MMVIDSRTPAWVALWYVQVSGRRSPSF